MTIQTRNTKGRFERVPGAKRYNIKDIEKAFLAGINASTMLSWQPPSQKLNKYLKDNDII